MKKRPLYWIVFGVCTVIFISCSKYIDTRSGTGNNSGTTTSPVTGGGSGGTSGGGSGGSGGTGGTGGTPNDPGGGGGSGGSGGGTGATPIGGPSSGPNPNADTVSNFDFDTVRTNVCNNIGETFTFTSKASGVPTGTTYEWYFGDGNSTKTTSTSVKTQYTYSNTYTVQMKATVKGVQYSATKKIKAYGQNQVPQASFTASVTNPNSGGNIYAFNAGGSKGPDGGSIGNYLWDFGDGTTASGSAKQNITHTYSQTTSDQSFTVKLTVAGSPSGCTDMAYATGIDVAAKYVVTGSFNVSSTSPCLPSNEVFTFTPNYTGVPAGAEYKWSYTDGNQPEIGNPGTSHTFLYKNNYQVTLTISYNGQVLKTDTKSVSSKGQDCTPVVSVYSQYTNPTTYSYNANTSIGGGWAIVKYEWDFGDGTTDTQPNIVNHVFPKSSVAKTYTISLKVTSNSGCTATDNTNTTVPAN
ncbi:MAG: PKD domain-containing protein [Sphingobacteriia bacterium]|nr:PKD domain-containing protein [Sphingobacteriia bacterium]